LADEMIIWRVVMEGLITITEIKNGEVDLVDLLKMNALLDLKNALDERAMQESQKN